MAHDDVQDIFQLDLKIKGLLDWAKNVGKTELCSLHALERARIAPYSTLQSTMASGRMSIGVQKALDESFGFRVEWPEWRDPRATRQTDAKQRADTVEAFLKRFLAHKSSGSRLVIETGRTATKVDRRFAEFAFAMPGSFEPSANADGIPLVLSLAFDRRGWPIFHDLTVRLKEVDVQLSHASVPLLPLTSAGRGPFRNFTIEAFTQIVECWSALGLSDVHDVNRLNALSLSASVALRRELSQLALASWAKPPDG